jgi:hypothetical protein
MTHHEETRVEAKKYLRLGGGRLAAGDVEDNLCHGRHLLRSGPRARAHQNRTSTMPERAARRKSFRRHSKTFQETSAATPVVSDVASKRKKVPGPGVSPCRARHRP